MLHVYTYMVYALVTKNPQELTVLLYYSQNFSIFLPVASNTGDVILIMIFLCCKSR